MGGKYRVGVNSRCAGEREREGGREGGKEVGREKGKDGGTEGGIYRTRDNGICSYGRMGGNYTFGDYDACL